MLLSSVLVTNIHFLNPEAQGVAVNNLRTVKLKLARRDPPTVTSPEVGISISLRLRRALQGDKDAEIRLFKEDLLGYESEQIYALFWAVYTAQQVSK